MNLTHVFFNNISADAKTETDRALYGIADELNKNYFPIRVADDQIYDKKGARSIKQDLFTVYKASFNKKDR